ncbi:MAG: hypothetical protein HQ518_27540 [Rhodopirellula sp.]|nr:hypothetical protein [Rhodopirellula sp.]
MKWRRSLSLLKHEAIGEPLRQPQDSMLEENLAAIDHPGGDAGLAPWPLGF